VALGVDNVEEPPGVGVGVPVVPAFVGDDTTVEEGASVAVTRPGGTLVAVFGGLRVDVLGSSSGLSLLSWSVAFRQIQRQTVDPRSSLCLQNRQNAHDHEHSSRSMQAFFHIPG
jgi:hypothetical protein